MFYEALTTQVLSDRFMCTEGRICWKVSQQRMCKCIFVAIWTLTFQSFHQNGNARKKAAACPNKTTNRR